MEILRKNHFWVVNFLVVGVCAGAAGRAAAHLVEGAYLSSGDLAAPVRPSPPPQAIKRHDQSSEVIVARDIFCSGCVGSNRATASEATAPNHWIKSSLQLELVSTMVCPSDEGYSMAVIRDLSTKQKDPELFHRGSIIGSSGLSIYRVTARRVFILDGGRPEYLELDASAAAPAAQNRPPAAQQLAFNPELGDIDKGVDCTGTTCTVDRSLVEKLLSNTTLLVTGAHFVPSLISGRPNGFKLFAIRPQSIFGRIGLQNGDTILTINGSEMTTPDAALALYTQLRNASHLAVQVQRRGETLTLDYTIR